MMKAKFEGGEALARNLQLMGSAASGRVLMAAIRAGALPVATTAAAIAPNEPGAPDLRANIVIAAQRNKGEHDAAYAVGPARGFAPRDFIYPLAQEVGTGRHAAQPFMRPAMARNTQASLATIRTALYAAIERRARSLVVSGGSARAGGGGSLA